MKEQETDTEKKIADAIAEYRKSYDLAIDYAGRHHDDPKSLVSNLIIATTYAKCASTQYDEYIRLCSEVDYYCSCSPTTFSHGRWKIKNQDEEQGNYPWLYIKPLSPCPFCGKLLPEGPIPVVEGYD